MASPPAPTSGIAGASPSTERHRLLSPVVLDGRGIQSMSDSESSDLRDRVHGLVPLLLLIVCVLLVVGTAGMQEAVSGQVGTRVFAVGGGAMHAAHFDSRQLRRVALRARLLPQSSPEQLEALAHVFYANTPPIVAARPFLRVLNLDLRNDNDEYGFQVLRWEVIRGGNVSVTWNFEDAISSAGASIWPDFLVLRSKPAFDMWRDDVYPPSVFVLHHAASSKSGSFVLTNQPTDVYYFIFSAPIYFWEPTRVIGQAQFQLNLVEFDLSGRIGEPPLIVCKFPLNGSSSEGIFIEPSQHEPSILRFPIYQLLLRLIEWIGSLKSSTSFDAPSAFISASNSVTNSSKACRITLPDPAFIQSIYIVFQSPAAIPGQEGGSGQGKRSSKSLGPWSIGNNPWPYIPDHPTPLPPFDRTGSISSDDSGTLDNRTVLFQTRGKLRFMPEWTVWDFLSFLVYSTVYIGALSAVLAASVFACVFLFNFASNVLDASRRHHQYADLGTPNSWMRRVSRGAACAEPLPVYTPPLETEAECPAYSPN
ncbi:hypothetical protein HDU77_000949 [Chytriomyces hyalinus]|nr:hypothetical protein HDU77_000949 [Chytriomyces hyalinus]